MTFEEWRKQDREDRCVITYSRIVEHEAKWAYEAGQRAGAASRDADIAALKIEFFSHVWSVVDARKERDQLREQMKTLYGLIFRTASFCKIWGGDAERARKMLEEVLTATEPTKEIHG